MALMINTEIQKKKPKAMTTLKDFILPRLYKIVSVIHITIAQALVNMIIILNIL